MTTIYEGDKSLPRPRPVLMESKELLFVANTEQKVSYDQELDLYQRLCSASILSDDKVEIDERIKPLFPDIDIRSAKKLLTDLNEHFIQKDPELAAWLRKVQEKYFQNDEVNKDRLPALKQNLPVLLSLHVTKKIEPIPKLITDDYFNLEISCAN